MYKEEGYSLTLSSSKFAIQAKTTVLLNTKIPLFETSFLCTLWFTSDFFICNTQTSINYTFILPNTFANLQSEQLQQWHLLEVSKVHLLFLVDSYEINIAKVVFCCLLLAFCFVQSSVLDLHFYLLLQFYLWVLFCLLPWNNNFHIISETNGNGSWKVT